MSKYTTEVRYICEMLTGDSGGNVTTTIRKAIPKIFDFDFPIFDEAYRSVLCEKILKHYYTREIGLETYGLWKLKLDTKLNEIMPYYNQLYKSALIEFNPLDNMRITKEGKRNNDGNTKKNTTENSTSNTVDNSNSESTSRYLYSDTPQGALNGVESENYLTSASKEMNGTNANGTGKYTGERTTGETGEATSTENYIETLTGKASGESFSKLLIEFRNTFVNIDVKVIDELSDLFMLIW